MCPRVVCRCAQAIVSGNKVLAVPRKTRHVHRAIREMRQILRTRSWAEYIYILRASEQKWGQYPSLLNSRGRKRLENPKDRPYKMEDTKFFLEEKGRNVIASWNDMQTYSTG